MGFFVVVLQTLKGYLKIFVINFCLSLISFCITRVRSEIPCSSVWYFLETRNLTFITSHLNGFCFLSVGNIGIDLKRSMFYSRNWVVFFSALAPLIRSRVLGKSYGVELFNQSSDFSIGLLYDCFLVPLPLTALMVFIYFNDSFIMYLGNFLI